MTEELKLKPCPFCGCSDISMYTNGSDLDNYSYIVECDGCGCLLDTGFESEERAAEEWNRRKEPERKKGEWVEKQVVEGVDPDIPEWQVAKCSVRGKYLTTPYLYYFHEYKYCPNCGAWMRLT